jgi:hypothetical protein
MVQPMPKRHWLVGLALLFMTAVTGGVLAEMNPTNQAPTQTTYVPAR